MARWCDLMVVRTCTKNNVDGTERINPHAHARDGYSSRPVCLFVCLSSSNFGDH